MQLKIYVLNTTETRKYFNSNNSNLFFKRIGQANERFTANSATDNLS